MGRTAVDPALLEGEELKDWFTRSAHDVEAEREASRKQAHDAFFGPAEGEVGEGEIVLAEGPMRSAPARLAPVYRAPPPPAETRAAVPPPGAPRTAGAPGSFLGSFAPLLDTGTYLPGLPYPLNRVEQSVVRNDHYVLADNTLVGADELERIYAEQQQRLKGQELEPSPYAKATDRLKDGQIPLASQLEKGMWERDPTCHPYGGWELDPGFTYYPKRSQDYEAQVTGARGVDYVVRIPGRKRGVKFDGCDVVDPSHPLQEAKGPGYRGIFERARRSKSPFFRVPVRWPQRPSHSPGRGRRGSSDQMVRC